MFSGLSLEHNVRRDTESVYILYGITEVEQLGAIERGRLELSVVT